MDASSNGRRVQVLDGPLGTELLARGVPTPLPGWSAHALETHPEIVGEIHGAYALAGASLHTTNTFRTRAALFPETWSELVRSAVRLARCAVPAQHTVAGSIAPLLDCYRPDLSPADSDPLATRAAHFELATALVQAGCDALLCETFPHLGEGLLAVDAALEAAQGRDLEVWISFTPGYEADLLTPDQVALGAREAVARGARAALVNCVPAARARAYVEALCDADLGVPLGCYANAGAPDERMGWTSAADAPERYAEVAATWLAAGASWIGGCCGTGPAHTAALVARNA